MSSGMSCYVNWVMLKVTDGLGRRGVLPSASGSSSLSSPIH
jgi:hypothetical protein